MGRRRRCSYKNTYEYFGDIVSIEDTNGNRAYIDKEDLLKVIDYTFYKYNNGYFATVRNKKLILLHRLITGANSDLVVDHINRCKLDNRRCNLRVITQKENILNRGVNKNNILGFKGISYEKDRNKYVARYKGKYIGRYLTLEEAIQAWERVDIYGK